MEYIHSKDIFLLIRDTLKLVDRQAMDHGSRVAYLLYKMLECRGGYEKFELADFVFLASVFTGRTSLRILYSMIVKSRVLMLLMAIWSLSTCPL